MIEFNLQKSVSWKERWHLLNHIKYAFLTGEIIKNVEVVGTKQEVVTLLKVIIPEVTGLIYKKDNRKLRSAMWSRNFNNQPKATPC
jgi:hypothetical protein